MPPTPADNARRVARGRAIDWTDEELDELSEIRLTEDTPLMLAFIRQHGPRQLVDVVTAARESDTDGNTTPDA